MRGPLIGPLRIAGVMIAERDYPRCMTANPSTTTNEDGAHLEASDTRYEAALAEWREWDRRAVESQSCDVAVAALRSLEALRALERRRGRRG